MYVDDNERERGWEGEREERVGGKEKNKLREEREVKETEEKTVAKHASIIKLHNL